MKLQITPRAVPVHFVFKLDIYFTTKFKNVALLVLQVVMPLNRSSKNGQREFHKNCKNVIKFNNLLTRRGNFILRNKQETFR